MSEVHQGTLIGSYRVEEILGHGSMGEVYRALDESLQRRVAIKILTDSHRSIPELRVRFLREARAVAAINHPNVVQIFSVGEHDGRPYLAMEFLEGPDLGRLVREQGPLPSSHAAGVLLGAARGLREASRSGVIHRDVKPSNLVVSGRGEVKVTDFGLAKATTLGPTLTKTGIVVGTPDYIAPEQARGDALDERADIYALGCSLFHLVSGRPPFHEVTDSQTRYMDIVMRHLKEPVPNLAAEAPDGCDRGLSELCARMMAKQAEGRPSYDEIVAVSKQLVKRVGGDLDLSLEDAPGFSLRSQPEQAADSDRIDLTGDESAEVSEEVPAATFGSQSAPVQERGIPSWMWVVTMLSVGIFAAGLWVRMHPW